MKYKGFTIKKIDYQDCDNYQVITPRGDVWADLASNTAIAKKWIDCHIHEQLRNAPITKAVN